MGDIYRYLHRYLDTWISSNRHQHSQSSTVDRGQQLAMAVAPSSLLTNPSQNIIQKVALSPNRMAAPGPVPASGHRSPCAVLPVLPSHLPTQSSKYIQFSPGIIIVS